MATCADSVVRTHQHDAALIGRPDSQGVERFDCSHFAGGGVAGLPFCTPPGPYWASRNFCWASPFALASPESSEATGFESPQPLAKASNPSKLRENATRLAWRNRNTRIHHFL
jgi:hypothetical protein